MSGRQRSRARRMLAGLIGSASLRAAFRGLAGVPALGPLARTVARRIVPQGTRVWVHASLGDGLRVWLYLDPRYELTYASGCYEPHNVRWLREILIPGTVFYDVGAHIGVVSLLAAHLVGREGAVFAFEPDPHNFARLERNVERNGLPCVRPVQAAVWSTNGGVTFEPAPTLSSGNRGAVAAGGVGGARRRIEVHAVSLDDFAARHPAPDVIKIDVEGGEIEVLRGARRLLTSRRPALLCEVHAPELLDAVREMLDPLGYVIEPLSTRADFPFHVVARPDQPASAGGASGDRR